MKLAVTLNRDLELTFRDLFFVDTNLPTWRSKNRSSNLGHKELKVFVVGDTNCRTKTFWNKLAYYTCIQNAKSVALVGVYKETVKRCASISHFLGHLSQERHFFFQNLDSVASDLVTLFETRSLLSLL